MEYIKKRSDADMLPAYDVLYNTLENSGHATKLNKIYNEASLELNRLLKKKNTDTNISTVYK